MNREDNMLYSRTITSTTLACKLSRRRRTAHSAFGFVIEAILHRALCDAWLIAWRSCRSPQDSTFNLGGKLQITRHRHRRCVNTRCSCRFHWCSCIHLACSVHTTLNASGARLPVFVGPNVRLYLNPCELILKVA